MTITGPETGNRLLFSRIMLTCMNTPKGILSRTLLRNVIGVLEEHLSVLQLATLVSHSVHGATQRGRYLNLNFVDQFH